MYEIHKNEQYFFDKHILDFLSEYLCAYKNPCCVCAPLLGKTLAEKGKKVYILDIDTRFSQYAQFIEYDIYRPRWLGITFDIIVCDPPFFRLSLSQLFHAMRVLSRYDFTQKLMVGYLSRRATNVEGTFSKFHLRRTGIPLTYQTVQKIGRNDIELFTNLHDNEINTLQTLSKLS
jgi:hypothetical protein